MTRKLDTAPFNTYTVYVSCIIKLYSIKQNEWKMSPKYMDICILELFFIIYNFVFVFYIY